jgi:serine/threonine protein kinase
MQTPYSEEEKEPQKSEEHYDEIELISQGSYGCVFRPDIPCEKELRPNKKYISKIQIDDLNSKNEVVIGEQIKTIPLYFLHFSPILSECVVSIQQLSRSQVEKCSILNEFDATKSALLSTKIKYVGNKNIEEYFLSLPRTESTSQDHIESTQEPTTESVEESKKEPIQKMPLNAYKSKLLYCFYYVLQSAKILNEKGIIHFDIKERNIMYDEYIQSPLLIDFGLSFIPQNISPENISSIFYTKRVYPYWCIEIYMLCYIVNRTTEEIIDENHKLIPSEFDKTTKNATKTKIEELLNTYQEEMVSFFEKYMDKQFTSEEIETYITALKNVFAIYEGTSWTDNVYNELFKPELYNTWDIYSIAITFSCILNSHLTKENMEDYTPFIKILKSIILSPLRERPNYTKVMEML